MFWSLSVDMFFHFLSLRNILEKKLSGLAACSDIRDCVTLAILTGVTLFHYEFCIYS